VQILKDLSVTQLVTIPADLAEFVEMATSISPILVFFLRFTSGQQMAEVIGNSDDLRQSGREFREVYSKRSSKSASHITAELYRCQFKNNADDHT
jgi:hypothetical protein